jgi:DNA-binding NtrC family response regulator
VDVRIVAATNRDLAAEVKRGTFREDLYYRLNVVPLVLPPLRDRREDIPLIAHHLLRRIAREQDKEINAISPTAMQVLVAHPWPGNVRELENVVRRAVVLAPSNVIQPDDLALGPVLEAPRMLPFGEAKARVVEEFERAYLTSVLVAAGGNVTRAAEMAEKDRKSFWELLQKHKINPRQFKPRRPTDGGEAPA